MITDVVQPLAQLRRQKLQPRHLPVHVVQGYGELRQYESPQGPENPLAPPRNQAPAKQVIRLAQVI